MDRPSTGAGLRALPAPTPVDVACPGCGAGGLVDVFEIAGLPVLVGALHDDLESARAAARGDVTLAWCAACDLVHNRLHDPDRIDFAPGYEISLRHSPTFRAYVNGVADRLVERHGLRGKRILEIGCGDGYFLRLLAERGIAAGVGVDPTLAREGRETVAGAEIEWVRDYFEPERHDGLDPDFVASLSAFEDIPRPAAFLRRLRATLSPGTGLYFEAWNAWHAFREGETWSVHYEQCNLFGAGSLAAVFERAGYRVLERGVSFEGDQYAWVEAEVADPEIGPDAGRGPVAAAEGGRRPGGPGARPMPDDLRRFAARHRADLERWRERLADHAAAGRRVVLWGSGAKGITFLNVVPGAGSIVAVADINPDRQGRFVPGTGHPVVAPESLPAIDPDVTILTNPLYEREIRDQAGALGLACDFELA